MRLKQEQCHLPIRRCVAGFFKLIFAGIILATTAGPALSQSSLSGQVSDEELEEVLEKATVYIQGSPLNTMTDRHGTFHLKYLGGFYQLEAIYPGFHSEFYNVSLFSGIYTPMGAIRLEPKAIGRPAQRDLASLVRVNQHPGTTKNFSLLELMDQSGSTDLNELFLPEPSFYILENGGGYGRSELTVRGFGPDQTGVVFNGISLNDPETGRMNTPLYSGMSDWAGQLQLSRGPASGKQSQLGYGGLINLLPLMPQKDFGVSLSANMGHDGYVKTAATVHTGKNEKDLAAVLKIDRSSGDGFADQTGFKAYGLYLNMYKEFGHRHSLFLTATLKTWQSDLRNRPDSILVYGRQGFTYNNSWGLRQDQPESRARSFGVNPMIILSHNWHLRVNTRLVSQLYAALNRSAESFPEGRINGMSAYDIPRDDRDLIPFDLIENWNRGMSVDLFGESRQANPSGRYINTETEGLSLLAATTKSSRLGLQSQLIHHFDKQTRMAVAFDAEQYRASHAGAVMTVWGADGFLTSRNVNDPEGRTAEHYLKQSFFPKINKADKVSANYDALIRKAGISGKIQNSGRKTYTYAEGAASVNAYRREDHFSYLANDDRKTTDWAGQLGFRLATGLIYRLNEQHSFGLNSSAQASQARFELVFPSVNNWKNADAGPENLYHAELGYRFSREKIFVSLKGYAMYLQNHAWIQRSYLDDDQQFAFIHDVDQFHRGLELSSKLYYLRRFILHANGSAGNWTYWSDAKSNLYGYGNELLSNRTLPLSDYKVANAPQVSFYVKNEMKLVKGLFVNLNYYYADKRYAPLLLNDFDETDATLPGQLKLERYDRLGAGGSFFRELRNKNTLHLSLDIQNLLNNEYINQIFTNESRDEQILSNQVLFGNGRSWRLGLTYSF
ncbi:TonB-dependent receptor plug domain-containing protein [Gaoshiqia sp. Z1-71]|uniref:TonB-dependent receptor plug domain-containing protein n=1 Tax=Gaoshiqia hydrogeniformans TaxID=3290090 RepID=UPI003BF8F37D